MARRPKKDNPLLEVSRTFAALSAAFEAGTWDGAKAYMAEHPDLVERLTAKRCECCGLLTKTDPLIHLVDMTLSAIALSKTKQSTAA